MQDLLPALINGVTVAAGLFILWSLVGGMRELPASFRAKAAIAAGGISAIVTLVVTLIIRQTT